MEFNRFAEAVAELGYASIDVPPQNDSALAKCRELELQFHATAAVNPGDLSRDDKKQAELSAAVIAAVEWAGRNNLRVITHLVGKDPSLTGDENIAIFKELYTPIAARAEKLNVGLAFENWPRNGTMLATTPEMWDAMFEAVPSPALGLCYDPSHFYWQGIDYIQPIRDFGDRIIHAHAKDTEMLPEGMNAYGIYGRQLNRTPHSQWWRYRLPGYGGVDWYRCMDELYKTGYNQAMSVEHEDVLWAGSEELALRGLRLARQFMEPFLV